MADLRRVLGDVGRVQAQLEAAVNFRLQGELGLPLVLFQSMTAIADTQCCRVQELAAGLGVSAGSASKLADRLCAQGFCRRLPNLQDRRSYLLQLTPAGQGKLAAAGGPSTRSWSTYSGPCCQLCRSRSSRPRCGSSAGPT